MSHSDTLLLTIDLVNDICHPDGAIASCVGMMRERAVVQEVNRLIWHARQHGMPVAHTRTVLDGDSTPSRRLATLGALRRETWGSRFVEELDVVQDDLIIDRPRVGIFFRTDLEDWLRQRGIRHLLLCGVSSDHAVESAVREAHDRDLRVTVIENACAAACVPSHAAAMTGLMSRLANVMHSRRYYRSAVLAA